MLKWFVGLVCLLLLLFFTVIGVVHVPSFIRVSNAQYNVAPAVCTTTNKLPVWDGTNWTCATTAVGISVTPTTSSQTAKQILLTQTLSAGYLGADGNCVRVTAWGTCLNNANLKTQTIDFGATTVANTGAVANNNGAWFVEALVCRTGASAQTAVGRGSSDAILALLTSSTPAENTANAIAITITSTNVTSTTGTTVRGFVVERVN